MYIYKTQEYIDSLRPEPGFMLIKLLPENDSYYSGGIITMVEPPKQPFSALVIRTGGPEYMLSNGQLGKSRRQEGDVVIIDPTSYPAHMTFTVQGKDNEPPIIYRLVPEYIVICSIDSSNKVSQEVG